MTRKEFLKKFGAMSATAFATSAILGACAGGEKGTEADCSRYNASLTDQDLETRKNLGYVEKSPKPDQNCSNCRFWQPDKFEGACGGCQLFANGAVNPEGYCKSWVTKG